MELHDPVAAYDAVDNFDAHFAAGALQNAGIPAKVIEDMSGSGVSLLGPIAKFHHPEVWVQKADLDRAKPILAEYDRRAAERWEANRKTFVADGPIEVTCEKCGKTSTFPAAQNGSVQNCPHCRAYVDVGNAGEIEGWDEVPAEDEAGE